MTESENMKFARANYGKGVELVGLNTGQKAISEGEFDELKSGSILLRDSVTKIYIGWNNKWATIVQPKEEVSFKRDIGIEGIDYTIIPDNEIAKINNSIAKSMKDLERKPKEEVDVEALALEFVRDCAENWDCDEDSHKYNTPCRMCEAMKIMGLQASKRTKS